VLVNAVAPAPVETAMTAGVSFRAEELPLGCVAQAPEIAGPIAFLVSPAASYMSGAVVEVNGCLHFS
jgi:3-oxoacyl-[acyl-carrier protein] reductase